MPEGDSKISRKTNRKRKRSGLTVKPEGTAKFPEDKSQKEKIRANSKAWRETAKFPGRQIAKGKNEQKYGKRIKVN